MDPVTKILAFLVVLGVLVVFHELGHFVVARWETDADRARLRQRDRKFSIRKK